jgi:hypothetical protein
MKIIKHSPLCANGYQRHRWESLGTEFGVDSIVNYSCCEHCGLTRWLTLDRIDSSAPAHCAIRKVVYYHDIPTLEEEIIRLERKERPDEA